VALKKKKNHRFKKMSNSYSDVESFHHGPMSREDCERLLEGQAHGTYLFRQRTTNLRDHVLSVLAPSRFVHLMVKEGDDGKFATSRRQFDSLSALVASYPGLASPLEKATAAKKSIDNGERAEKFALPLNKTTSMSRSNSNERDVDLSRVYRYIGNEWRAVLTGEEQRKQQQPKEDAEREKMREHEKKSDAAVDELSFVTFNVWFDGFRQRERAETLFHLTSTCRPDVVCFQEVTAPFLEWLLAVPWVQRGYYVTSASDSLWATWYGLTILSKHPIERLGLLADLETRQGRRFLYVDLRLNGDTVRVGTMHLESYDDSKACRHAQLSRILPTLAAPGLQHSLLLGDMNLCATWPENRRAFEERPDEHRHQDLWAALRPDDSGWTENTDINKMRAVRSPSGPRHVRFDRVFLRSTDNRWLPHSIELLGTVAISHNVWPSDHFGLHARIRWHASSDKQSDGSLPTSTSSSSACASAAASSATHLDRFSPLLANAVITDKGSPRIVDACDLVVEESQSVNRERSRPQRSVYDQGSSSGDDNIDSDDIGRQESLYAADFGDVPPMHIEEE
jgi:tyrosyl-DNA phosphodiesterase 2